jgi:hypothetical protein
MFLLPIRQDAGTIREAARQTVNVIIRYRLQDDPSKLVFEECDLGPGLNAMFAAKHRRNYKLAF